MPWEYVGRGKMTSFDIGSLREGLREPFLLEKELEGVFEEVGLGKSFSASSFSRWERLNNVPKFEQLVSVLGNASTQDFHLIFKVSFCFHHFCGVRSLRCYIPSLHSKGWKKGCHFVLSAHPKCVCVFFCSVALLGWTEILGNIAKWNQPHRNKSPPFLEQVLVVYQCVIQDWAAAVDGESGQGWARRPEVLTWILLLHEVQWHRGSSF